MSENSIKFYRVKRDLGWIYYAAKSEQTMYTYLNKLPSCLKYELDTLEQIDEKSAQKAPFYKLFTKKCIIHRDGTWLLGILNPETLE